MNTVAESTSAGESADRALIVTLDGYGSGLAGSRLGRWLRQRAGGRRRQENQEYEVSFHDGHLREERAVEVLGGVF